MLLSLFNLSVSSCPSALSIHLSVGLSSSKVYMADLESALHYLLRVELATHNTLGGEELKTFKSVVTVIAKVPSILCVRQTLLFNLCLGCLMCGCVCVCEAVSREGLCAEGDGEPTGLAGEVTTGEHPIPGHPRPGGRQDEGQ